MATKVATRIKGAISRALGVVDEARTLANTAKQQHEELGKSLKMLRDRIGQVEDEIHRVERLPMAITESLTAFDKYLDRIGVRFRKSTSGKELLDAFRYPRPDDHRHRYEFPDMRDPEAIEFLAFMLRDEISSRMHDLLDEMGDTDTISASDRAATLSGLREELDALLRAEQEVIGSARAAGMDIPERGRVVTHRADAEQQAMWKRKDAVREYKIALSRLQIYADVEKGLRVGVQHISGDRSSAQRRELTEAQQKEKSRCEFVKAVHEAAQRADRVERVMGAIKDPRIASVFHQLMDADRAEVFAQRFVQIIEDKSITAENVVERLTVAAEVS